MQKPFSQYKCSHANTLEANHPVLHYDSCIHSYGNIVKFVENLRVYYCAIHTKTDIKSKSRVD